MPRVRVSLRISADQYSAYYRGTAKSIVARADDGRKIQFPVGVVQQFVTRDGILGDFIIEFDDKNKFKSIKRV